MKSTTSLTCLMLLLPAGSALAQGECLQFRGQIERSCETARRAVEARRSVDPAYDSCVAAIPGAYASIISLSRSTNLYAGCRSLCWEATHVGPGTNCRAKADDFLVRCRTSFGR